MTAADPKPDGRLFVTNLESGVITQWIGAAVAVILIAGLVFLLRRSAGSAEPREKELFRLCRGDKEMMERLISHEQEKRQSRSRDVAIQAATDLLKRDNR